MTLESKADTLPGDEHGRLDEGGADGSVLPRCSGCMLSKIPIPRAMRSNICAFAILNFNRRIFGKCRLSSHAFWVTLSNSCQKGSCGLPGGTGIRWQKRKPVCSVCGRRNNSSAGACWP